jgi:hypothetical protein
MLAHALNAHDYPISRVSRTPGRQGRALQGPMNAHQRLVMKAMAVFPGSEVFEEKTGCFESFPSSIDTIQAEIKE